MEKQSDMLIFSEVKTELFFYVKCIKNYVTVFKLSPTEHIFLVALHDTKSFLYIVTMPSILNLR